MDVRTVEAGDTAPGGGTIEIEPAIEVGNIFKLGTRYSEPLGATYLDEDGQRAADRDGQLRDRPGADRRRGDRAARRRAAASSGRASIAPWQVHLVSLAKAGEEEREAADRLYEELRGRRRRGALRRPRRRAGGEADRRRAARLPAADRRRPPRPRRGRRRGAASAPAAPSTSCPSAEAAAQALGAPRAATRWPTPQPRSAAAACAASSASTAAAPPPRQTRKGEPLRPLDDPQPRRLRCASRRSRSSSVLAFESGDGRSAAAAIVFWLIAAGDYLDGFLARVTGQYSRLGALLDPLVDRLTILAGAVVCWHFELLPRWALALLALRELAMLVLAQYGLRHGVDIEVNWPGRISVFPIMGGIFFALVVAGWVPTALLILGLGAGDPRHRALRPHRDARGGAPPGGAASGASVSITFNLG